MIDEIIAGYTAYHKLVRVDNDLVALIYEPYLPYADGGELFLLDSYFRHYDKLYHLVKDIKNALSEKGVSCYEVDEKYDFKLLFVAAGLGKYCKNRLIRIGDHGTFCALYAFGIETTEDVGAIVDLKMDREYWLQNAYFEGCNGCDRCRAACPTGALSETFDWNICVRKRQLECETEMLNDRERGRLLLGCNRCQVSCPYNPKEREQIPEEIKAILDYDSFHNIVNGGKQVISLLYPHIGKNYARPKKLNYLLDVFCHKDK